jgi:MFS family permease
MLITIVMYSLCTGLSAFSRGFWDFALYRFLTGLGVGGEFAVGVALVAEVIPSRARAYSLTILQMLSAVGNIIAALIVMGFGKLEEQGLMNSPWRKMFLVGAAPAMLALVIRMRLKEPERWKQASRDGAVARQLGSYAALFGDPRWRKNAVSGLVLAFAGVVGLWGIGFFAPDLTGNVMRPKVVAKVYEEQIAAARKAGDASLQKGLEDLRQFQLAQQAGRATNLLAAPDPQVLEHVDKAVSGRLAFWGGVTGIMTQFGAFCGMFGFGWAAQRIGRRPTFAIAFIAAFISTASVFWYLQDFSQLFWMVPIMGFCQLSLFAGYAVYFPELFPTHLRSTGTSFCYNVGRFVAASGPFVQARLTQRFASSNGDSLRYAGVTMCGVFIVGLLALPFLPETKGKPLPE